MTGLVNGLPMVFIGLIAVSVCAAPERLTDGPGNDTEAAWSPDGRQIVFQSERRGELDLYLLDVASRKTTALVAGPGNACYPAWSPDGRTVAYSFGHITRTAVQGITEGYGIFTIAAAGGEPQRLTGGLVRDYVPAFSPDGKFVWFSSTRGLKAEAVGLQRVPATGGTPETVLAADQNDVGFVQPTFSPDGTLFAYGFYGGLRTNWTLRIARLTAPGRFYTPADPHLVLYGPRWSPDGKSLACTGFRPGEPGWGLYLLDLAAAGLARLDTGPGNSRSPAWSPDSKTLVYENNVSGKYQLYRLTVPAVTYAPLKGEAAEPLVEVLRLSFDRPADERLKDLSGKGNDVTQVGRVPAIAGGLQFEGAGYLTVPQPKGFDFGTGSFTVAATVSVDKHTDALRMLAVGDYPESSLGWQLYLDDENHVWFNSRTTTLQYVGARSDAVLPVGRKVRLEGVRRSNGVVSLSIDGVRQASIGAGARLAYTVPRQLRIGTQYNSALPLMGRLYELTIYAGVPASTDGPVGSLRELMQP